MSAKKEEQTTGFSLEKAMIDYSGDKYDLIVLASIIAAQKGKSEEFRSQPRDKVIKASLEEYLSGNAVREAVVETYMSERKLREEKQALEEKRQEQKSAAQPPRLELRLSGESL